MLTGRQPFTGETPIQVAFQHVNNDVPAPSELVDWLPIEIDDAVRALAARDPDDRPVDAAAALALLRRTRAALDDETLARHAAVAPSIVLPAATDPAETDLDADDDESDDDDDALDDDAVAGEPTTTRPPSSRPGTPAARRSPCRSASASASRCSTAPRPTRRARAPPRPLDRPARPARGAHRRRHVVVPAAGTGRLHDRPDDHRSGRGGGDCDPRARRARRRPVVRRSTARHRSARSSRPSPGQGDRIRKDGTVAFTISKGPDFVAVPDGVVGKVQADAEAALVAAGLKATTPSPSTATRCRTPRSSARPCPTARPAEPGAQAIRGTRGAAHRLQGSRAGHDHVRRRDDARGRDRVSSQADNLKLAPTEVFSDTVAGRADHRPEPRRGRRGPPRRHDRGQRLQGPGDARPAQHVRPERQDGRSRAPGRRVHGEGRAPPGHLAARTSSTRRSPRAARARRLPRAARSSSTSSDSAAAPPA